MLIVFDPCFFCVEKSFVKSTNSIALRIQMCKHYCFEDTDVQTIAFLLLSYCFEDTICL